MQVIFKATIPAVDSGRLLMEIPTEASVSLEKMQAKKVHVTIHSKTYLCNLFNKEGRFYLHIISRIKKDVGIGKTVTFKIDSIENSKNEKVDIHSQVLSWETGECKALMQKIGVNKNDCVVDFGCGYGHYSIGSALALEQSGAVFAIDCDGKALKWINEKKKMFAINNIKTRHTNGASILDFLDSSVDVILLYDVLHIQEKESKQSLAASLYKEAYRVLKRGGILSTLNFPGDIKKMIVEAEKGNVTMEDIDRTIIDTGFVFSHTVEGGVHFDWYHSKYRMEKGLAFEELERGTIYNYIKEEP